MGRHGTKCKPGNTSSRLLFAPIARATREEHGAKDSLPWIGERRRREFRHPTKGKTEHPLGAILLLFEVRMRLLVGRKT
jgi:hypothetical protein